VSVMTIDDRMRCVERETNASKNWSQTREIFRNHLEAAVADAVAAKEAELESANGALRSLACWLSVGGYNAESVDPDVFEKKIRDGVESLVKIECERVRGPRLSDSEEMALLRRINAGLESELAALRVPVGRWGR